MTEDPLIALKRRPDLVVDQVGQTFVVKDPVSLKYFEVGPGEHAVLHQLDGQPRLLSEILSNAVGEGSGVDLSLESTLGFLNQLVLAGLACPTGAGQGKRIREQQERLRSRQFLTGALGFLSRRFPLVNPQKPLLWFRPIAHVLLSPIALVGYALMLMSAMLLVAMRMEEIQLRLPRLAEFIAPTNMIWIAGTILAIKFLHEVGHAAVCDHFRAECHEFGIMLLVLIPVYYCNVTDSWTLPRWKRVAVSAAGMAVELVIAAACVWLWWFSKDGFISLLLLNVILVCSVGTLLFNGNPLLRFDGYFILQDLAGVPNLASESRSLLAGHFDRVVFGTEQPHVAYPRPAFQLAYAVCSVAYRVLIGWFILFFLYSIAVAANIMILFYFLSVPILVSTLLMPVYSMGGRFMRTARSGSAGKKLRAIMGLAAFLACVAAMMFVPVPNNVKAICTVRPADATPVYVVTSGRITEAVLPGEVVQEGGVLAKLANPQIEFEYVRLRERTQELALQLQNLERRRTGDESVKFSLPASQSALKAARDRLSQLEQQRKHLEVLSPVDGTIIAPPNRLADEQLASWTGSPLDQTNRGAVLQEATLLCYIGKPDKHEAVVLVPQESIQLIRKGQPAELQLTSAPGRKTEGVVTDISPEPTTLFAREIIAAGLLPVQTTEADRYFEVTVQLNTQTTLSTYAPGNVKITCEPMPLGRRFLRLIRQTFTEQRAR